MYTVREGDYLAKIAKQHGLGNWQRIYDHEQNAEFRKKRPNPNVIYPGDQVFVPDKEPREVTCMTEKKHTFVLQLDKPLVRVQLRDSDGYALPIAKYELKLASQTYSRSVAGKDGPKRVCIEKGLIDEKIKTDDDEGELKIWVYDEKGDPDFTYTLKIGYLDPVEEMKGIQARLNNLRYDCGKVDGVKGPKTEKAVKQFQKANNLLVDGKPGPKTQAKLREIYGC